MSIATMEELESIPVGKAITVGVDGNAQAWKRVEAGWENDVTTLAHAHFEGAVRAGQVSLGAGVQLTEGSWVRQRSDDHWLFVLEHLGERVYRFARYDYNGNWQGYTEQMFEGRQLVSGERPTWRVPVETFHIMQQAGQSSKMTEMIEALHKLHERWTGTTVRNPARALDSVLEDLGVARREDVTVTIAVTGTSEITPHLEAAQMVEVEQVTVTLPWSMSFEHTVSVKPGTCACKEVTEEVIQVRCPKPTTTMEWSASCPNDK